MFKTLIALALLTSAVTSFAETSRYERKYERGYDSDSKLEGTLPTPSAVTDKSMYKIHMGLTAGVSNPNGNVASSPEYGVNVGFQPYIPFGVGAEVSTTEMDNSTLQRTNLLARGSYNFGGDVPVLKDTYVGVMTGPMFQNEGQDTEWSMGPTAGFDIPLQNKSRDFLSLGLSAKYLYTTDVEDSFSAGVGLKYWY